MILYGLKNCDTCKKSMKALGADASFHDVRADGITKAQLTKWVKAAGWETLLNTRSTTWRGLDDNDKSSIDEKKAIALMTQHPTLIKRPVIEHQGQITVGWSKEVQTHHGV